MDIKTALKIVQKEYDNEVIKTYEFKDRFVFILETNADVKFYVCVDKNTSDLAYTNFVGLQMMLAEEEPIIK